MFRRRSFIGIVAALVTSLFAVPALATPPVLVSAVSRMAHGTAGNFDVMLPLTGGSGIECRNITNGMTLVATFDQPVTGGTAAVAGGTAAVVGNPAFSGSTMSVTVNGITDASTYSLTLSNVTNAGGETLAAGVIPVRTLFGDVNGDGILNGSDVNICRAAVGSAATITAGNFRSDVNADGILNGSDTNQIRVAVANGASVAGGATNNTPPTISTIANQSVVTGVLLTVGFTVGDPESAPGTLVVSVTSSDQVTIPNSNITTTGTTATRTLSLTPAAGITAVTPVTISMTVSDGLTSTLSTFTVKVTPPPMTYLATLSPIGGTGSLGSGTATLTVSGDMTYATLVYSYSNLSSTDTDDAIYNSAGGVMYDIPVAKAQGNLQANGSYLWTFNATKAAAIVASIQSNTAYILLESANFPAGELQGTFKAVTGSILFIPPVAPPVITINPPLPADASRFMQQAAFGGNTSEIAALSNTSASNARTALNDWLTAQFNSPVPIYPAYNAAATIPPTTQPLTAQSTTQPYSASSMYYQIYNRVTTAQSPNTYGDTLSDDRVHESWYKNAVTGPDQLRQKIATAYSEIFVVSEIDSTIDGNIPGLASYYDMLADDAFVNFRQLLGDVTLHPIMGNYLNMQGNNKTAPNENYAREVMQLFTIGLYALQPDGTLMLDNNGLPIPTYTQPLVTSFASVYTGWNTSSAVQIPTLIAPVAPATTPTVSNFSSYYQVPMVVNASNHSTIAKTLLNYAGAATYSGATTPGTIPATTSQTSTTATAELNFALDNLFNHPNVGPFICKQLIQRLVESNPSPGYVYRVAQVFNNDGTGTRGNMKAVITAILTDYEARSPAVRSDVGYGHMREPIHRMANILHSCNAVSKSGKWTIGKTDNTLAQTIFRSPTVFNFFSPTYTQPGVIQLAGLVSPELAIIDATTITNSQNMIYTGIYANYNTAGAPLLTGTGFRGDAYGGDVYLDLSTAGSGLVALATTSSGGSSATMLNQVVLLLNGGPLDSTGAAQARIQTFLNTLPNTNPLAQTQAAIHLVATASQCAAEK